MGKHASSLLKGTHPPTVEHFVLTRFNVRYVENPNAPSIATGTAWLQDRFELFERYCLPSINSQTNQDFTWLLFFDADTPEPFVRRARELLSQRERSHAILCKELPIGRVQEEVRSRFRAQPEWLLTTRLDNDDGLHMDFTEAVRKGMTFSGPEIINAPLGLILQGQKLYAQRHLSNAFISLAEPLQSFKTVFSISRHMDAAKTYPVRQIQSSPFWLQVIHSRNISNRVRGWRVPLKRVSEGYETLGLSKGQSRDHSLLIVSENLTLGVFRALTDLIIRHAKAAAARFGIDLRRKVKE